jgi:nucleoside phosphorylase
MSAAAIVQTCFANGVRCQIVRIVTDHADESARSDFEASLTQSAQEPDCQVLFKTLMSLES